MILQMREIVDRTYNDEAEQAMCRDLQGVLKLEGRSGSEWKRHPIS